MKIKIVLIAFALIVTMIFPQVARAQNQNQYIATAILVRDANAYNILTQSPEIVQKDTVVDVFGIRGASCLVVWYEEYNNWKEHQDWLACSALYFNKPI